MIGIVSACLTTIRRQTQEMLDSLEVLYYYNTRHIYVQYYNNMESLCHLTMPSLVF